MKPLKVTFVITGLHVGGAEIMLLKLLSGLSRSRFTPSVVTLSASGELSGELPRMDVPLYSLGLTPGRWSPGAFVRLVRYLRDSAPDILQGWMYHGNLAAQAAAQFMRPRPPVVWNIRGTVTDLATESLSTAATIWLGAKLSRFAAVVVNNSHVSARLHRQHLGYSTRNVVVIANGFDTSLYRPDSVARAEFRRALSVDDEDFLIGHVGRLHPMKDHETLLRAAETCISAELRARFVLVGADVSGRSQMLLDTAERAGIGAQVKYLGPRTDIARIMPGLDLFTLTSSYGEGFPNAVGEAMACGVPCAVTDVGDSAHLVGESGTVVAPGDAAGLAEAWLRVMRLPAAERARLGTCARQRIMEHFSLTAIVQQYEELYDRVARQQGRA